MVDPLLARLACEPASERARLVRRVERASRALGFEYRPRASRAAEPHPLALTPLVLPPAAAAEAASLARAVLRLHDALPALHREGRPEVLLACPLERRSREWLALLPRRGPSTRTLIRIDVSWTEDWAPVLFETNATAVAGFLYHPAAVELVRGVVAEAAGWEGLPYGEPPDVSELLFEFLAGAAGRRGRVGIVEEPPFGPGDTEMPALARRFSRRGLSCVVGAPWEVRRAGRGWSLRGRPVDWLFRDLNLHELPAPGSPRLAAFEAMARAGRVLPGPGAEFDHKGMLELLTSRAFERLFTREQVRLLRRCVPWTRVVYERRTDGPAGRAVDLTAFVAKDPALWVVKPNRGCGGEGVVFGRETPGLFRRTLERAARFPGGWVVQERKDTRRRWLPLLRRGRLSLIHAYQSVGVFCGGGRAGFYSRVNPKPVVNVGRGGAVAAVFLQRR
ncbi:MAG: hypothetical protein HY553_12845 [Elusimicrobia bacterium]|nr:hypothetical protein [Elusimicrobiota bacterium]